MSTLTSYELNDVLLVGHSYGGMVVTGALDRTPERVRRLVYLDAFVPDHGVSCNDLCGADWTTRMRELAAEHGDGWQVPFPFTGASGLPADVEAWYLPRMVPQPLATLDDPVELTRGAGTEVPRTFVKFLEAPGLEQDDPFARSARRARDRQWQYQQVVAPHDLHVSDPDQMAGLLHDMA